MKRVEPGYNNRQGWGSLSPIKFPKLLRKPPRAEPTELNTELAIVCVCVGPKFPAHYVHRLKSMVARNLSYPHRFYCITDRPSEFGGIGSGIHVLEPERQELVGWYSKINLFNPENFAHGTRVMYFDLDVVITGSLDRFAECQQPFIMIREFNAKPQAAHNSSVMSWLAPYPADCYMMPAEWMERSWGDQECIWTIMGNDRIWDWPDSWVASYKYHGTRAQPSAPIVVFYGDPKQDAVADQWVKEHWQ